MTYSTICNPISTLKPEANITAANAAAFREEAIEQFARPEISQLVIDMAGVEFLDSAGLMALVTLHRLANTLNKSLSFRAVPPAVRIVLELTQLDRTFNIDA